ncbi:YecA family protein [Oceanobacillus sojae]|uniref:YecA family protein n=1 Tax=Oceanobacillus sojae TaxID=582851 RepID=UPI0021A42286|nr:SEC-C metal-binding domain-containing protein [Oceanobacillus sojae]MCT1905138.1 SEC-C metal-binding domain-containing protein [Oceanobacillus sojae]
MVKKKINYNHVAFSNNMSIPMRNNLINELSENYKEKTNAISEKISKIIDLIHQTDPLQLMNFLVTMDYFSNLMMGSEIEYEKEQILHNRAIEYIQSLLVSKAIKPSEISFDKDKQDFFFHEILAETVDLYNAIQEWYFFWSGYAEKELKLDAEDIGYIIEAQMFSLVRGERYQIQMEEHLLTLIGPLDNLLKNNYNISSKEVVRGLLAIEKSLTHGRGEAATSIQNMLSDSKFNVDYLNEGKNDGGIALFEELFGSASNDVEKITNWPKDFIKKLSLSIGESEKFCHQQYNYWPIVTLPIQRKPFIEIEGSYYCFAYYNLFDNIYRSLQKILFDSNPINKTVWEQTQKETSEKAVANIFKDLLPGCDVFCDNYYPEKESLRRMNENDILIKYENSLFIVEVKAGSFSPMPALLNYQSHLSSYKSLVEKADQQCQRTLAYLKRKDYSPIYDQDKNLKETFYMKEYDYIYTICVTIDDFNEFAAKAEKLNSINIAIGTIVISINDLRTYKDYFESPFIFLNFLENRKNATQVKALRLTDELDHLGMYIHHNMYPKTFNGGKKNSIIHGWGYRQELDEYFISLWSEEIVEKPERELDSIRLQLLSILKEKNLNSKLLFSNFLLDFSTEGAQQFSNSISSLKRRQTDLNKMLPAIVAGDELRYVLFLEQPDIKKKNIYEMQEMQRYCDGMLAYGNYRDIFLIYFRANSNGDIIDLQFEKRKRDNINQADMNEIIEYGRKTFETRLQSVLRSSNKKKIGRNDRCPCGSGLKYKKCCDK